MEGQQSQCPQYHTCSLYSSTSRRADICILDVWHTLGMTSVLTAKNVTQSQKQHRQMHKLQASYKSFGDEHKHFDPDTT